MCQWTGSSLFQVKACRLFSAKSLPEWVHVLCGLWNVCHAVPGTVSLTFFHRNSNSMEISFHAHLDSNAMIATKFCTWHDSCAVVACAKLCCDLMASNRDMARQIFHRIWIAGKKPLMKRAPGLISLQWRHNERDVVSNHQRLDCFFNRFFSGVDQRKHQSSTSLVFVRAIHRSPVDSPHKGPVTWKMFSFHDVIIWSEEHNSYKHIRKT